MKNLILFGLTSLFAFSFAGCDVDDDDDDASVQVEGDFKDCNVNAYCAYKKCLSGCNGNSKCEVKCGNNDVAYCLHVLNGTEQLDLSLQCPSYGADCYVEDYCDYLECSDRCSSSDDGCFSSCITQDVIACMDLPSAEVAELMDECGWQQD